MFASLLETVFKLIKLDIKARLRAMTVSAVLTVVGLALLLTALGFGLALLYVWLQQMLGTIVALAIVAGACALLALILFAIAAWRPKPGDKPAKRAAAAPPPRPESARRQRHRPPDRGSGLRHAAGLARADAGGTVFGIGDGDYPGTEGVRGQLPHSYCRA